MSGSGLKVPTSAARRASPPESWAGSAAGSTPSSSIIARAAIGVVDFAQARKHIIERSRKAGQIRLLRQIGEARVGLDEARSPVGRNLPRRDPEQGRLARPVATDDGDALAGGNRQFGAVQKRRAAERQASVSQL